MYKTKIRSLGDKVHINFRYLNDPKDDMQCKSFTVISTDSLLVSGNKYYIRVYLHNCINKVL